MATTKRPPKQTRNEWADAKPLRSDVRAAQKLARKVSGKLYAMMEAKTKQDG